MTFVNLDIIGMLGMECVSVVGFMPTLLVALIVLVLLSVGFAVAYTICTLRLAGRKKDLTQPEKVICMKALFNREDVDATGIVSEAGFNEMIREILADDKPLLEKMTKEAVREIMTLAGATQVKQSGAKRLVLYREDFLQKTTVGFVDPDVVEALPYIKVAGLIGRDEWFAYCTHFCATAMLFLHTPVSAKAFLFFACHEVGHGLSYLRTDYGVQCHQGSWIAFMPVALILILFFVLGLPVAIIRWHYVNRKVLHDPKTLSKYGWLYTGFQKGAEWWEVHEL